MFFSATKPPTARSTTGSSPPRERAGFDDVLFLNQRDEITEGAISNIFVRIEGRLYTPPLACGVLPGVFRRHLLEAVPRAEERILTLADLRAAGELYLCNSVRGLRKAVISCEL